MGLAMWTPGPLEIVIILVIVLIIFGPKRLPDLGRSLGHGMREFKDSVTGKDKDELPERSADKPEPEAEPKREHATTASEQKS
jgi:sec-independent protein translocase protein TatA